MKFPKILLLLCLSLFLAGCSHTGGPQTIDADAINDAFDVSNVDCDGIEAARQRVNETYVDMRKEIGDTYIEAVRDFEAEMQTCLAGLRNGGPCDDVWEDLQDAYATAMNDISNDTAYTDYKAAKSARDTCHEGRDQSYADREAENTSKEQACRDMFQIKSDAASRHFHETNNAAKAARDAALAALDALEEECKKPKVLTGAEGDDTIGSMGRDGTVEPTDPEPDADACQGGTKIPGSEGTPRTGKAPELGTKDALEEMLVTIAEEVTRTPIPVNAISDRIFAGIVCVKIRTSIQELEMENIDAVRGGNRRAEIALRKKIRDYNRAMHVRCAIAEGRPPANLVPEMEYIQSDDFGEEIGCQSDSDCGDPVCCSETEMGVRTCNEDGECTSEKIECDDGYVCNGKPAVCVQHVMVIEFQGKYLPVDQLHEYADTSDGGECDTANHWHANDGVVIATDGSEVPDLDTCGYGKVNEVPTLTVLVE